MGKKSKSKAGGDIWDEDPELQGEDATEVGGSPAPALEASGEEGADEALAAAAAPTEGDMDEEFGAGGLMGALRRSKKKKDDKAAEEAEAKRAAAEAASAPAVQVKSKKEKEKEKKEREKAKKRAAAQRKMTAPAVVKKDTDSASATPEPGAEDAAEAPVAAEPAAKGGKKKKLNPALAALQKQLAAKKAAEEAQKAADEEAQRLAEEEQKRLEEEEAAREAEREAKRERERKKREELRAQGKLLSKKQKAEQALQARRREALLASGVQVAGLQKQGKMPPQQPRKPAPKPKEQTQLETPEATPEPEVKETKPTAKPAPTAEELEQQEQDAMVKEELKLDSDEEALMDDWEAGLSDMGGEESTEDTKHESESEDDSEDSNESEAKSSEPRKAVVAPKADTDGSNGGGILSHPSALTAAKRQEIQRKEEQRRAKAVASASESNLRSPICAILGHVDTGKTKLLDNMRRTNVQEGEAGGITQQIGATYFPIDAIQKKTAVMKDYVNVQYNVPGLLVIDTPGHESFSNLRTRGSSLCNIAILVVDIMHGLEPQTLESIRLLKDGKTPFVVALNKIDRLYGWQSTPDNSFRDSFSKQPTSTQREFEDRLEKIKVAFAEQGFNSELYHKNKNLSKFVSLVPTSAITGEGVPDLIYLLLELTQSRMSKQLMYLSELEATILEVKVIDGLGTTIDVVLSNGVLHEGDRVVLCGQNGPIATNVRALLTPQPMRELRIKGQYVHHKSVKAALGVKIAAEGLQEAVAGSRLLQVGPDDDEEELMNEVMDDVASLLDHVDKGGQGVCVQASTLGSLEALLDFLKDMKIPVMSINIGPVFKRDVMRAVTMLDKKKEYAVMLCFDVPIDRDAERYAKEQGITIFTANIIYHLFDEFTAYQKQLLEQRRKDTIHEAVFPAVLNIIQVINNRSPMIIGVDIVEGSIRPGTPIAIVKNDPATNERVVYNLGRIQSLEVDHKSRDVVRKGQANAGVAIRLDAGNASNLPTWGRQINEKDTMYSLLSRKSIDVLKDPAFRDDVPRDDWLLIKKMKPLFDIK